MNLFLRKEGVMDNRKLLLLLLVLLSACGLPKATMRGQWSGANEGFVLKLTLRESAEGDITGSGSIKTKEGETIALDVTGSNVYPHVTMTFSSTGYYDFNFTGEFSDNNTIDGKLNGSGFTDFEITLERQ